MTGFNYLFLVTDHTTNTLFQKNKIKLWILNLEQGHIEIYCKHHNWSIKFMHFTNITTN